MNNSSLKNPLSGLNILEEDLDELLFKFADERYPKSKANCQNSAHKDSKLSSQYENSNTPPNPFGSINLDIDLILQNIKIVDLDRGSYTARGDLNLVWCDPRRKFNQKLGEYFLLNDSVADLALRNGLIWTPELRFRNGLAERTHDNVLIQIFSDGTILYQESFVVELQTHFDIKKMPFDTQYLVFDIGSFTWDTDQVKILPEDKTVFFSPDFNLQEFVAGETFQKIQLQQDEEDNKSQSYLHAKFGVTRLWGVQLFKLLLPLQMLLFVSSLIFQVENDEFHHKIDIFQNVLLVSVAYLIVTDDQVPKYQFTNFINLAIMLAIIIDIQGGILAFFIFNLEKWGYKQAAKKLSWVAIIQYNLLYVFGLIDVQISLILESSWSIIGILWTIIGLAQMLYLLNDLEMKDTQKGIDLED